MKQHDLANKGNISRENNLDALKKRKILNKSLNEIVEFVIAIYCKCYLHDWSIELTKFNQLYLETCILNRVAWNSGKFTDKWWRS